MSCIEFKDTQDDTVLSIEIYHGTLLLSMKSEWEELEWSINMNKASVQDLIDELKIKVKLIAI